MVGTGGVRTRNDKVQERRVGAGQEEGSASTCVGRGASGSCSQDFLAECSGQPFFAPSTLGDEWERSSSVCSRRCWCPWYSGGQEAHPAPALNVWGSDTIPCAAVEVQYGQW